MPIVPIVVAILGAAAATTTGVLLERFFRKRDDDQKDGPLNEDAHPSPLPPPIPDMPPAPASADAPATTGHAFAHPMLKAGGHTHPIGGGEFPISPSVGDMHRDTLGRWWGFTRRGWEELRSA